MADHKKAFIELGKQSGKAKALTPCEVNEAKRIYNTAHLQWFSTTVQKSVADFFKAHNYVVEEKGIGWKISER